VKLFKYNLFQKSFGFLLIVLSLGFITLIMLIYILMPFFYHQFLINKYDEIFNHSRTFLVSTASLEEEIYTINYILRDHNVNFFITDDLGDVIFKQSPFMSQQLNLPNTEIMSESDYIVIMNPNHQQQYISHIIEFKNQSGRREINLSIPIQPLTDARHVLINSAPIAIGISFLISVLSSTFFSLHFIKPIKRIQLSTKKMANFDYEDSSEKFSADEIGDLSLDIKSLYRKLTTTIDNLEHEIQKYENTENKKIDFFQTLSHEIKAPLASTNALIESMLYEIAPFNLNKDYYLEKCHLLLSDAINLTKDSLKMSEYYKEEAQEISILELISEMKNLYEIIIESKNLNYYDEISNDVLVVTKKALLTRAISNIFSNAVNHTSTNGKIKILYKENCLIFENDCIPLSDQEMNIIFSPLYIANETVGSTGLGLPIIDQLLRQLNIPYVFNPTESGMLFKLNLKNVIVSRAWENPKNKKSP